MEDDVRSESVPAGAEIVSDAGLLAQGFEGTGAGAATILVVEDEERVRRVMSEVLRLAGYTVVEAEDAEAAARAAAEGGRRLHLLVTDVVLPGKSGRELVREMRGQFPGMKAVLISGYGESVARMGVEGTVDVEYLPKPFSATELMQTVARVLGVGC